MAASSISRRALLTGTAALAACGRRKATGYPGYCFVANRDSRSVAVVDLTRFRVRRQIPLDAAPSLVLPHPNPTQARVYVLAPETGTVYEIDAASLAVSRRARAGNVAADMQVSPAGESLWVLYRDPASLVELPFSSFQPRRPIRLPSPPDAFDLSRGPGAQAAPQPAPSLAAVASRKDSALVLVSLATGAILCAAGAGVEPSLLRFRSDGRQLIAGSAAGRNLNIFDVPSLKPVVRLPLPMSPRHFCFKHDLGQLFVSGEGVDAVAIFYPFRTEIAETMLAGRAPGAMQTTETPALLMVANPETDSITVLDFDNMGKKLVAFVQVGQQPCDIRITPDQQYALVLNGKSGDMAVIRIYALIDASPARRYKPTPLFTLIPVGEGPVSAAVVGFPSPA
jgi:DNA-binding beta-propeller fold protein YncE